MAMFLTLSGSASPDSCTDHVLSAHVSPRLSGDGHTVRHLALRDLPAEALSHGDLGDPRMAAAARLLAAADGVVVATPVHRAPYSGLLTAFLDVPPRRRLSGKAVLPLVTGHMATHGTRTLQALYRVLASRGATVIVPGCFLTERATRALHVPQYIGALERLDRATLSLRHATAHLRRQPPSGTGSAA